MADLRAARRDLAEEEMNRVLGSSAVKDGRFVAVGCDAEMAPHRGERARVIDAGGHTVIPGLNDSHAHIVRGGRFYNLELRWDGVDSLEHALAMVREQPQARPVGGQ